MTKNVPMANVTTRSSTRNAAAGTSSDRIVGATAKGKVAKAQQHHQAKASDAAAQATDQEISSDNRDRASRNKPDASKEPANRALTPGDATNSTPRPTTEVESGAVPVSGAASAAKDAKTDPRGNEGVDSRLVASNGLGIDDGIPVPDQRLDADGQAQSEDRALEHISETGASKGTKRTSQDAQNDDPPPATGKRARKSTGLPLATGDIGAPGEAPSEDPEDGAPPAELSRGQKFVDILLRTVITNRALRERREQYECCCRLVKDAQGEDERFREDPRMNPRGLNGQRESDRIKNKISEREGEKMRAGIKVEYLLRRVNLCVNELQSFSRVPRDAEGVELLADHRMFWRCFNRFRVMLQEKHDRDIELERAKQELTVQDNATKRLYRRVFEHGYPSIPAIVEANVFGDLDNVQDVMWSLRREESTNSELEEALKTVSQNVLLSAEDAFVRAGVLVHESALYNWDGSGQDYWPERDQEVQREREESEYMYSGGYDYLAEWEYQARDACGDAEDLRQVRDEQWNRYAPGRPVPVQRESVTSEGLVPDGCHIDGYGRVRKNWTGDRDPPQQEYPPQQRDMYRSSNDWRQRNWEENGRSELGGRYAPVDWYAPDRYAPDQYAPDRYASGRYAPGRYAPGRYASDIMTPDSRTPGR